jgi:hypothetical protein
MYLETKNNVVSSDLNPLRHGYGEAGIAEYKKQDKELGRWGVRVNVTTLLRYLGKTGKLCTE